ncbi:MAG: rhamnan synthesis F family protein [Hydrogenophaga sp.]
MSLFTWKLERELNRIRQQLKGIPEFFTEPLLRRRHDAQRNAMLQAEHGQVAPGPKVALLLVYQPKGISDATVWTCQHLVDKGYAPLIISNATLSNDDKNRLFPWTWRIAERPNFGYDFGGYRDGIWLLSQWKVDPDILIILNDSIWFPLNSNETLINRMENSAADFVGALQLDPLRQTENVPPKKRPFFGSFFLMLKRDALHHPAFIRFWDRYRLTSNKYKTIRRGERGFSHALIDAGITSEAIYTRAMFDDYLRSLDNTNLSLLMSNLVSIDKHVELEVKAAIANFQDTPAWRQTALGLSLRSTEKQNLLATAPIAALTVFGVPYLKKSRDWNNMKALAVVRAQLASGELPDMETSIRHEIDRLLD